METNVNNLSLIGNKETNVKSELSEEEIQDWIDSIENIIKSKGGEVAQGLISSIEEHIKKISGLPTQSEKNVSLNTGYFNTIPKNKEASYPGDLNIERKISNIVRWNALALVLRANSQSEGIGGHIATYASSATIYDVCYNHFFRGPDPKSGFEGDAVFFQGHASPGIYARAYVEGKIVQDHLERFRRELKDDKQGLPSYPHPRLMPSFWQFPTVSMGLGPLTAIALARFKKYLTNRKIKDASKSFVYAFIGDGETDEVETLGNLALASREKLDNLIFVVNCNLQRLDGPVRGNGKIIQELESIFRGANWDVIKVVWSSDWDSIFDKDKNGTYEKLFEETVDGEFQLVSTQSGKERREGFFSKYKDIKETVAHLSDEKLENLRRGGHDEMKLYAAFHRATTKKNGKPTVILAKTIKGFGMGESGHGRNTAHQQKKMSAASLKNFKKTFQIPIGDDAVEKNPFYNFAKDSEERKYLDEIRKKQGPFLPTRTENYEKIIPPSIKDFEKILAGSAGRAVSTTMAFVQILSTLLKDKNIGKRVVPIIPDESRTFGMEGLFKQYGIFSTQGQLYTPVDSGSLMAYTESKSGQIYQEGIDEAGATSTFIATSTSYSTHSTPFIPFYIYYSMFGFQRTGDLIWAAADMKARGFLIGGTAGRTTLNGEGLQHEDGHSHILASTVPSILCYDPAYAYELAVIVQYGVKRMYADDQDGVFYITVYNENYPQIPIPEPVEKLSEKILKGIYLLDKAKAKNKPTASLLASGISVNHAKKAKKILEESYGVNVNIYSVTSFKNLREEAIAIERENMLSGSNKTPYITKVLQEHKADLYLGVSDFMRSYSDLISRFVPGKWFSLGTDGFGRSSSREELREYFETDENYIVISTLYNLEKNGKLETGITKKALKSFNIDAKKKNGLQYNLFL